MLGSLTLVPLGYIASLPKLRFDQLRRRLINENAVGGSGGPAGDLGGQSWGRRPRCSFRPAYTSWAAETRLRAADLLGARLSAADLLGASLVYAGLYPGGWFGSRDLSGLRSRVTTLVLHSSCHYNKKQYNKITIKNFYEARERP